MLELNKMLLKPIKKKPLWNYWPIFFFFFKFSIYLDTK